MARNSSPRRENPALANGALETAGAVIADGRTIDLIFDEATGHPKLIWFDGTDYHVEDRIEIGDQTIVPFGVNPIIEAAMALPTRISDYGSTRGLFAEMRDVLIAHGMSEITATAATYHAFATWFPEVGSPSAIISGPCAESTLLLQLMSCFVRRGLLMVEVNGPIFRGVINALHPTLLIDARHLGVRSLRKLSATCGLRACVSWKGSVVAVSFARAIYVGAKTVANLSADFSLQIRVAPSRRMHSLLDEKEREQITAAFQPRFLDYRLRNFERVRAADFVLPEMDSEGRVIGRLLGACVLDAPEVQAGVLSLLETREAGLRAARWTDSTCVIIEALLDECHTSGHGKLYVGEIAKKAEVIMKARGAPGELDPRAVGEILRGLDFVSERKSRGFRIELTNEIISQIHRLAYDYRVAAVEDGISCCSRCTEFFTDTAKPRPPSNIHKGKAL